MTEYLNISMIYVPLWRIILGLDCWKSYSV